MSMAEPWPLPDPAPRRRGRTLGRAVLAVVGFAVLVVVSAVLDGDLDGPDLDGPDLDGPDLGRRRERSARDRLRAIGAGKTASVDAAVFGPAPWCPRYADWGRLVLRVGEVVYSQGVERRVPVADLAPVRVRRAAEVQAPVPLPPTSWVLDVEGPGGGGSIAARSLADLAVLGAVAGWAPPPDWPMPAPTPTPTPTPTPAPTSAPLLALRPRRGLRRFVGRV